MVAATEKMTVVPAAMLVLVAVILSVGVMAGKTETMIELLVAL